MSAAASPADILRAVERWAQVREWLDDGTPGRVGTMPWLVYLRGAGDVLLWERLPPADRGGSGQLQAHYVSPAIALAWALLVETGAEPVDVGRCPACVARSGKRGGRLALATEEWLTEWDELGPHPYSIMGFDARVRELAEAGWSTWKGVRPAPLRNFEGRRIATIRASRPCPECLATTRATVPVARMLLDAVRGDADASARLLDHADHLQERGDPFGELLGWALTLWTGEPTDCGPCPACHSRGWGDIEIDGEHSTGSCSACAYIGRPGRQLGHPHTADAVAWLDRLTDKREDDADELVYGARFREFQRKLATSRRPG